MASPGHAGIKVLVVDDQPVVADGIGRCLAAHGFEFCGIVSDVQTLPAYVTQVRPGLVVVNTAMQNRARTLAVIDEVVSRYATFVLAFTADVSLVALQSALESGCLGVVPRSASVDAFVAGACAVASGQRHLHQQALRILLQGIQSADIGHGVRALSARELDVLQLIAEGLTNAAIAEHLGISRSTVKTHVENVLHKLSATDRAHAVSRAMRLGRLQ